jgi:hypothetical protein
VAWASPVTGMYGFHCKSVTARGVPLPQLTQPTAVSRMSGTSASHLVDWSRVDWLPSNFSENMRHSLAQCSVKASPSPRPVVLSVVTFLNRCVCSNR